MAAKIDWYYHRPGCVTCGRSLSFLESKGAKILAQTNATKEKFTPAQAVAMAREASDVYIAKGKKVVHYRMKKDAPSDEELAKHLTGPSGNMRAPVIRRGKTMLVGFLEGEFAELLD